jgi:hypothetical protein
MSLGSSVLDTPSANSNDHGDTNNLDSQLESLMEEFLDSIRIQNSLKMQIKQLLKEREAEAKRKEDEARKALRKAEEERKAIEEASVIMKEKMKQVEMIDREEEENGVKVKKPSPTSPHFSPPSPPEIKYKMEKRMKKKRRNLTNVERVNQEVEEDLCRIGDELGCIPIEEVEEMPLMEEPALCEESEEHLPESDDAFAAMIANNKNWSRVYKATAPAKVR